ncbi:MAG: 3-methyl-2-oxobutanoate hydroxymethyltransferase [Candidatus Kapabacteria bacterium]|jgi:3-methyl-2-oxobutanoate hydroxymethyltransferase|nr:3-methyl-2-oxobutanoate hydroxymethyltransferase [Candidatus Kapabacteria bacterium]
MSATPTIRRKVTTRRLIDMKRSGQRIACLTAYDALTAGLFDAAGIDVLLVGDSVGNVVQGHDTTIPVTLDHMIYHTQAVIRGTERALVVTDMPFMSYQVTPQEAFRNAGRLMKEAGSGAVKLEGGRRVLEAVRMMTDAGIPVMGHLGLTPQSIHQFGSYKERGVDVGEADQIKQDAEALQEAGAFAVVLEKVPAPLAEAVTAMIDIPTIGIGAGSGCDGQILVWTDMMGMSTEFRPRFVRRYAELHDVIQNGVARYIEDVRTSRFPDSEESYQ